MGMQWCMHNTCFTTLPFSSTCWQVMTAALQYCSTMDWNDFWSRILIFVPLTSLSQISIHELWIGMAIPRRISFLEESRSRGMINLHSSGIEEYEIYSSGSSGNFEEWVIPKILKIPPKIQKKIWKKNKKKSALNLHFKVRNFQ